MYEAIFLNCKKGLFDIRKYLRNVCYGKFLSLSASTMNQSASTNLQGRDKIIKNAIERIRRSAIISLCRVTSTNMFANRMRDASDPQGEIDERIGISAQAQLTLISRS